MVPGKKCPACASNDTEMLIQLDNRKEYECFSCSNIWTSYAPQYEVVHLDPLVQWGETGEDIGL